ncbi:MAG TPA: hypothetical protein VM888_04045, partial [Chitinophagaceae bacterium]|nr:hypothetical protein [Chitinophagaceae bacterium]
MLNNFKKNLGNKEYYLLLLPLFFVFHGYVAHYHFVPLLDALLLILFYLFISLSLWVLFYFILRSWRKAAIFTLIILSFHFFFGSLHDGLKYAFGSSFITRYTFLLPVCFLVLVFLFIYVRKSSASFFKLTCYINSLLLLLLIWDAVVLIQKNNTASIQTTTLSAGISKCDTCTKPDIFLIIADEYAGHQELKEIFKFDNTPFENELKSRGFHIINNARSNYNGTPFSVASTLNMSYLSIKEVNYSNNDLALAMQWIQNNNTVNY